MNKPSWLLLGDEFLQEMYRYIRAPIAERVVGDIIGESGSSYASWLYAGDAAAIARGSRSSLQINVDEIKPDVVVIVLGTSPAGSGLPVRFFDDVQAAVAGSGRYGAQVVLVGPFGNDPLGKRLGAMRRVVPDVVSGVDLTAGLPRSADGVHFTADGYRELTRRMVEAVFVTLARRGVPMPPAASAEQVIDDEPAATPPTVTVMPVGPEPSTGTTVLPDEAEPVLEPYTPPPLVTVTPVPGTTKTEPPTGGKRSRWSYIVGGILVLGAGIGGYLWYRSRKRS